MDYSVEIVGDRNALRNLDRLPDVVRELLLIKVTAWTGELKDQVEEAIINKTGSSSGRMLEALDSEVTSDGGRVEGRVFINGIPYARIQDQGGVIPAHIIRPRNAKVLAFIAATGDKVFATEVFHPGATIVGKGFMKDARRSMGAIISRGIKNAIVQGIRAKMRGVDIT